MKLWVLGLAWAAFAAAPSRAAFVPTHRDSGWVRLFNGKDLAGLYPHVAGGQWGENPGNIITVHDSLIHTYAGRKRANKDAAPNGVLSTDVAFSHYQSRVQYRHGDFANDGWLAGDPYNSGFFFHAQPGGPVWPQAIECQLKIHWNSVANKPCTAEAKDCDKLWAGDYWLLMGVQIQNQEGALTQLGGCCQPGYATHSPDYELEGWNTMEIQVWGDSLFKNILNGHEVNHGSKSTWLNPQGQRVPLKKGRVQLELEGSEFLFKNWEIRLAKQDSLYSKWYKEGCMDPAYQEYDKSANLHVAGLCKTKATAILEGTALRLEGREPYAVTVRDVRGRVAARYAGIGPGTREAAPGLHPGIYFLDVRQGSRQRILRLDRF